MESLNAQCPPIYHVHRADSEPLLLRNLYRRATTSVYRETPTLSCHSMENDILILKEACFQECLLDFYHFHVRSNNV